MRLFTPVRVVLTLIFVFLILVNLFLSQHQDSSSLLQGNGYLKFVGETKRQSETTFRALLSRIEKLQRQIDIFHHYYRLGLKSDTDQRNGSKVYLKLTDGKGESIAGNRGGRSSSAAKKIESKANRIADAKGVVDKIRGSAKLKEDVKQESTVLEVKPTENHKIVKETKLKPITVENIISQAKNENAKTESSKANKVVAKTVEDVSTQKVTQKKENIISQDRNKNANTGSVKVDKEIVKTVKDVPTTQKSKITERKGDISTKHLTTENLKSNIEKSDDDEDKISDLVCQIPVIDPFNPVAMKHIKIYQNKEKCEGKKYSLIEDGMLKLNIKKVKGAALVLIGRNGDFGIDLNHWISFSKKMIKRKINEAIGKVGCISTQNNAHLNDDLRFDERKCSVPLYFTFERNGRIKTLERKRCLAATGLKAGEKVILKIDDKCDTNASKFQVHEDGFIKHVATGLCLHVVNYHAAFKHQVLTLSKDCNTTDAKFDFIEPLPEDINVEVPVTHDTLKLMLVLNDDKLHVDFHLYAAPIPNDKLKKINKNDNGLKTDIAILLFDSNSAANFQRLMPKTMGFLNDNKDSFVFKANTVVGDATSPQVAALLTGSKIPDLPESRRSMKGAGYLDRWPLIFKELHDMGYLTLLTEDDPGIGAFNLRFWGFNQPPTSHYGRPFWLASTASEPKYYHGVSCLGDKRMHRINIDYVMSSYKTNKDRLKFSFMLASDMVHYNINGIQYADDDLTEVLSQTKGSGVLNNTVLIIMADHGSRYGDIRESIQGKIEERQPFLGITLPERIRKEHPDFHKNMRRNSKILTSHFDLYATLKHILSYPSLPTGIKYGGSLFTRLNETQRTCEAIGIADTWCPCLTFEEMNTSDSFSIRLAKEAVSFINKLVSKDPKTRGMCTSLELDEITHVGKKIPNKKVQRYYYSSSTDKCATCETIERNPDFTDILYEITFRVKPSGGVYEASVHAIEGKLKVNADMSRINKYGTQAKCVENTFPHLRKYCYCK